MQFVLRLKRRSGIGLQRELVDAASFGEEWLGRARAPRAARRGFEGAVGEEVEKLSVDAPLRFVAVVTIGRSRDGCAAGDRPQPHHLVHIGCGRAVREPLAVVRPGETGRLFDGVFLDQRVHARCQFEYPNPQSFVGVRDASAIGRRHRQPTHRLAIVGLALGRAHAVGGKSRDFEFAGFIGNHGDFCAIGHELRRAVANAAAPIGIDGATLLGGHNKHATTNGEDHAVAVGRDRRRTHLRSGIADPTLAHLIEIGCEMDVDFAVGCAEQIVDPQIGPELIDNAVAVDGRVGDVEVTVMSVLLEVGRVAVHRPQIHAAAAITDERNAVVPSKWPTTRAGIIGGERLGLKSLRVRNRQRKTPQLLRSTAGVTIGVAALKGKPSEDDG